MMKNTVNYQLFVSGNCTCCDQVIDQLKTEKIIITTINIDQQNHSLPFSIVIFPALVKENKLVSYGCDDIITHLKSA